MKYRLEDIKDPNVVLVGGSPVYDPARPVKGWMDVRATDPANHDRKFLYNTLVLDPGSKRVVEDPMLLTRDDAGTANVPPIGFKGGNGEVVPLPVRKLEADEVASIDPFNRIFITTADEHESTIAEQLARIEKTLDKVLKAVSD